MPSLGKGALSLPRELELRTYEGELQIVQRRFRLEQLRGDEVTLENVELQTQTSFRIHASLKQLRTRPNHPSPIRTHGFGIRLAESDEHAFTLGYDTTSALSSTE